MKLSDIFALLALSVIVKGAWWIPAVQPVILSIGAILTAFDLDVLEVKPVEWRNWQIFKSDKKETPTDTKEEEERPSAETKDVEWNKPGYAEKI